MAYNIGDPCYAALFSQHWQIGSTTWCRDSKSNHSWVWFRIISPQKQHNFEHGSYMLVPRMTISVIFEGMNIYDYLVTHISGGEHTEILGFFCVSGEPPGYWSRHDVATKSRNHCMDAETNSAAERPGINGHFRYWVIGGTSTYHEHLYINS